MVHALRLQPAAPAPANALGADGSPGGFFPHTSEKPRSWRRWIGLTLRQAEVEFSQNRFPRSAEMAGWMLSTTSGPERVDAASLLLWPGLPGYGPLGVQPAQP